MTRLLRLAVLGAAALALSACVSLLPKTKPAHLYRFGEPTSAQAQPAPPAGRVGVFHTNSTFQRESAGDRLLTVTDGAVAYIGETRWVAPAAVLWDQALLNAFDADPGPARIVSRGEPASADFILRVDVRNFEAHYDAGPKAAPTVLVRIRAAMMRGSDRNRVVEQVFESSVPAADNRVTAIVPAYDKAVADVLKQLVDWTNQQVGAAKS